MPSVPGLQSCPRGASLPRGRSTQCSHPSIRGSDPISAASADVSSATEASQSIVMETKANDVITGTFTLAVIVAVFGFVFWFQQHSSGARTSYRVTFQCSVSGLQSGAPVTFNGIRVGEVSSLDLDAEDPRKVTAVI